MRGRWHVCYGSRLSIIYILREVNIKYLVTQGAGITTIDVSGEMAYNTLQLRGAMGHDGCLYPELCPIICSRRSVQPL